MNGRGNNNRNKLCAASVARRLIALLLLVLCATLAGNARYNNMFFSTLITLKDKSASPFSCFIMNATNIMFTSNTNVCVVFFIFR